MMAPEARAGALALRATNLRSTVIEAAADQAAMQPWIAMECFQLGRGKQLAQMTSLDLGNQKIVQEHQQVSVQKLGITPPNLCTVSCCTPDPRFRFSELGADGADTLFFMPGNYEFDLFVPVGAQTTYVSFDQDAFVRGARALDPDEWEQAPKQLLSIRTTQQANFRHLVKQCFEAFEALARRGESVDQALVHNLLLQNILHFTVSPEPNGSTAPAVERARAFHTCRAARAFVEDRLAADGVPTIVDICTELGISERTLQYAFRSYVHMSPLAYLRMCRLNRVRETLLAADPQSTTVTAVAMRYGFLHLGRFSVDYRRAFHEAPSATLGC